MERFFVKASSVNAVRRALDRAPGGARVIGRFDRKTIECGHTMSTQSLHRHWPVLLSRLEKSALVVVERPCLTGFDDNPKQFPSIENEDGRPS